MNQRIPLGKTVNRLFCKGIDNEAKLLLAFHFVDSNPNFLLCFLRYSFDLLFLLASLTRDRFPPEEERKHVLQQK